MRLAGSQGLLAASISPAILCPAVKFQEAYFILVINMIKVSNSFGHSSEASCIRQEKIIAVADMAVFQRWFVCAILNIAAHIDGGDVSEGAEATVIWRIDHGYAARYEHNRQAIVSVGDAVNDGDVIAGPVSTGRSTGPLCIMNFWGRGKESASQAI